MISPLPYEIWAHIASFISKDQLETLYSVNKAFFDISMGVRYKTLWLKCPDRVAKLKKLQDPVLIAGHIRDLHIDVWILYYFTEARYSQLQRLRTRFRRLIGPFAGRQAAPIVTPTKNSINKVLLQALSSMRSLTSVLFVLHHTFPKLKRVDFAFHIAFESTVVAFLNAHAESIEELKFASYRPAHAAPFSIAALRLPLLRSLLLEWDRFGCWNNDVPYRQLWTPGGDLHMLERLEITSTCIDVDHLGLLCNALKSSGGSRLRYLELPCRTTDASTFDRLSETLPNLRTLILPTLYLSNPGGSNPEWNIEAFAAEMETRAYPTWTLYDLEITPPFRPRPIPFPSSLRQSYQVMQIVANHIPNTYDYFLMLSSEIKYVWQAGWGIGKVLYLLSRYPILIFSPTRVYMVTIHVVSDTECRALYELTGCVLVFAMVIAENILVVRVWSLWHRRIWVGVLFACIAVGDVISVLFSMFKTLHGLTFVFLLMVIAGVRSRSHGIPFSSLMYTFYKDGLVYFASLLAMTVVNLTINLTQPPEYTNLLLSTQASLFSVLSTRMLLNLRQSAHRELQGVNSVLDPNARYQRYQADSITGLRFAANSDEDDSMSGI
ncbi:hypothetical protein EYR38_001636 [Pleurotus pulmonarius]|nr:hypothetical protein EYR38_001636 [Pleurotus pulmonarius]